MNSCIYIYTIFYEFIYIYTQYFMNSCIISTQYFINLGVEARDLAIKGISSNLRSFVMSLMK